MTILVRYARPLALLDELRAAPVDSLPEVLLLDRPLMTSDEPLMTSEDL
jgi:hypothetical protein